MIIKKENKVSFVFDADVKEQVYLCGDFNNWNTEHTALKRVKGKWTVTLDLAPGEYQYRYYTKNAQWYNDQAADRYVPNTYGDHNSVVIVEKHSALENSNKNVSNMPPKKTSKTGLKKAS